jgi:type II secretory pathway pseudopilin PulG
LCGRAAAPRFESDYGLCIGLTAAVGVAVGQYLGGWDVGGAEQGGTSPALASSVKRPPPKTSNQSAFTLAETLVGMGMLAMVAAGSLWTMNWMNVYATASRLYSEATAKAEQQIDTILTKGPFDPLANPPQVPDELTLGTATQNGVLIYRDPVSNQTVVTGTMTTTVSDTGLAGTVGGTATSLNLRQATVTVAWTFRGKDYSVSLDTLRAGDQ